MFLLEYVIKLLMGNSDTIFLGLFVVVFGYYGWLLWNIYTDLNNILGNWKKNKEDIELIKERVGELEKELYQDISDRLSNNHAYLKSIDDRFASHINKVDKLESKLISEIEEETDEVKETLKLLLNCYRNMRRGDIDGDEMQELENMTVEIEDEQE